MRRGRGREIRGVGQKGGSEVEIDRLTTKTGHPVKPAHGSSAAVASRPRARRPARIAAGLLLLSAFSLAGPSFNPASAEEDAPSASDSRAHRDTSGEDSGTDDSDTGIGLTPGSGAPGMFLARLAPSLGNEPASQLRMRFEVTFMRIDVADLEARVAPQVSALIEPMVLANEDTEAGKDRIATLLMAPEAPILLTMTYLRDADYDRFSKGLRTSMKQAAESGAITESESESLSQVLLAASSALEESGVSVGGVLAHYIDGDDVHTVYMEPDGTVRVDDKRTNATLGRALRASWFGEKSRFREKLLKSLFE